jgi:hypothetical protein
MPNNEELNKLNEQLLSAHSKVEKAMKEAEESKKLAEEALSKAQRAEERAKKNYERFIRKAFLAQMKEFLGGAPVIMDVFYDDNRKLPPEDEPDKNGCRFTITAFQKGVYVSGEYASLSPIKEDFFDVINGMPPIQKPYDGWSPSVSNIPFMPKKTTTKWVQQRYVPIHKFETMREMFQRNYDKFIDRVKTQIASWKKELDGAELYTAMDEDCDFLFVVGEHPFYIVWHSDCRWGNEPKKHETSKDKPFETIRWNDPVGHKKVAYRDACKILDNVVKMNETYFKNTMKSAKQWFNHCAEIVAAESND